MTKNYMADVAKMLGVELGEEFKIEGSNLIYKFFENELCFRCIEGWCPTKYQFLDLIKGDSKIVKLPWRPKKGEVYCRPMDGFEDVDFDNWSNHPIDFALKEAGMIFRTKEECEAALPELRKKYLGGENNE